MYRDQRRDTLYLWEDGKQQRAKWNTAILKLGETNQRQNPIGMGISAVDEETQGE